MVEQMGLQAPFITSWACSANNQCGEGVRPVHDQIPSLLTLGLLSFRVRSHSVRTLDPVPSFHGNIL